MVAWFVFALTLSILSLLLWDFASSYWWPWWIDKKVFVFMRWCSVDDHLQWCCRRVPPTPTPRCMINWSFAVLWMNYLFLRKSGVEDCRKSCCFVLPIGVVLVDCSRWKCNSIRVCWRLDCFLSSDAHLILHHGPYWRLHDSDDFDWNDVVVTCWW